MTTSAVSKAIDAREFRNTMGLFATGVTVVVTEADGEPYGMTANAVASVSLDPALVLVCVQKTAHLMTYLRQTDGFSINILSQHQEDLSRFFAGMWRDPEPPNFKIIPWNGGPRLSGILGAVACQTQEILEGGDHWIVIGRVIDLYQANTPDDPLLFYQGQYRQVAEQI